MYSNENSAVNDAILALKRHVENFKNKINDVKTIGNNNTETIEKIKYITENVIQRTINEKSNITFINDELKKKQDELEKNKKNWKKYKKNLIKKVLNSINMY